MYKGLIFDFDGTLFTSEGAHFLSFQLALKKIKGIHLEKSLYQKELVGLEDGAVFKKILGPTLDSDSLKKLLEQKACAFEDFSASAAPTEGVLDFLQKAYDSKKYLMAICTGAYRSDIDAILKSKVGLPFKKFFRTIVTASDVSRAKPDPEGYLLAAENLGLKAADCLAFEDSPPGLRAARLAGMKVWAVPHSYTESQLSGLFDRYLEQGFLNLELP